MTDRVGYWMQTIGGRAFYPLDPHPNDIDIQDIAHALSLICRFGGHCTNFYSVAEHCVRVSRAIEAAGGLLEEMFAGLLHDAAEAYVGDMVWPLKQSLADYKRVEQAVERVIFAKYGLPAELPPIVKRFDLVLLSTEKRDLTSRGDGAGNAGREALAAAERLGPWHSDAFAPLAERIVPVDPLRAKHEFLDRFFDLRGGEVMTQLGNPSLPLPQPSTVCSICNGVVPDGVSRVHTALCAAVVAGELEKVKAEVDRRAAAVSADLEKVQVEMDRHRKKWEEYERDYILPCFQRATEIGFDLEADVLANPGKNCVQIFFEHLCERINDVNLLRVHAESELARAIMERDVMSETLTLAQDASTKDREKIRVLEARLARYGQ